MAPTPLITSAPALKNCVGVGRPSDARRRLRSGEEVRSLVKEVGDAGISTGIWVAFSSRYSCSCKPTGTSSGIEGDESGVNRPLPQRGFLTRDSESSPLDTVESLAEI